MYKCTKKILFLVNLFRHVLTILAWTKCRLVTKHALSSKYFHSCFFLTFPFKFYSYKKFKLSIKDYLLLIYTFMCMIIFSRIISFQSHQPAFLVRVWEWRGIGTDCPELRVMKSFYRCVWGVVDNTCLYYFSIPVLQK